MGCGVPADRAGLLRADGDQVAVRTRFLDQTLLNLTRAGCAQVVLLAYGMDTRAFRLGWPADTTQGMCPP